MESVVSRAGISRLPWRVVPDPGALWIFGLTAALVLYLGLEGGGYDPVVRSDAGVIVWWIVLVGALVGVLPAARMTRTGWAALGLLGALIAWTAIASTWSLSSERSLEELSRLACYLAVLTLAVTTYGDRRRALRHAVAAVGAAIVAIALLALLSRLRPGTFSGAEATASFLPGSHGRLSWPLNYWNALAALMAIGLPLLLAVASSARTLFSQAAAAAAVPVLALTGYLTFSRGGAIAAAAALIVFIALVPDRVPKLATLLLCAAGSSALVAAAVHRHAIEQGLTTGAARDQGATLLVALVLVCAGVALAQVGIGLAARHGTPPRFLQIPVPRARALSAAALAVVVIAALSLGGAHRLSHVWHEFKRPNAAALHQDAIGRFGALSGNGRYTYWKTAVDAMPGHWLKGFGPGSFQLVWLPRAPVVSYVRNAHSLYIETLTEVGIVGLVLLCAFLLLPLGTAVQRVARARFESRTQAAAIAAACVAFFVSAAFDWVWQVPVLPVVILLLAAAVLAPDKLPAVARGPRAPSGRAPAQRLAGRAALAAVAVAGLVAIGVPLATANALRRSEAAAAAGDTSAALADARSAIRIEPDAATPQLQEALVLELQGHVDAAVAVARTATSEEPQNWETWLILSRLEAEAGHPRPALTAYRRARALNPESLLFAR